MSFYNESLTDKIITTEWPKKLCLHLDSAQIGIQKPTPLLRENTHMFKSPLVDSKTLILRLSTHFPQVLQNLSLLLKIKREERNVISHIGTRYVNLYLHNPISDIG